MFIDQRTGSGNRLPFLLWRILFSVLKINFELLVINETQFVKKNSCFENQFELLDKLEEHFVKDVF